MKKIVFTVLMTLSLPLFVLFMAQCQNDAPEELTAGGGSNRNVTEIITEEKIYSDVSLKDDFADDKVLVVMRKEADLQKGLQKTYGMNDFPELRYKKVENLSSPMIKLALKQIEAQKSGNWNELKSFRDNAMLIDIDKIRHILCFTLTGKSKENVIEAIRILEKREDVLYAGPDYVLTVGAVPNPLPTNWASQRDMLNRIWLPEAWDITTGSTDVKVGVVDTGIQGSLPAFSGRIRNC